MKADQYFATKAEMTAEARAFRCMDDRNWYVRTSFECGHQEEHKKPGILLIRNERVIRRLILCKRCKNRVRALDFMTVTPEPEENENTHRI